MTDEEISALTLGDLERIAERFGKAVGDIRAAQALFGRSGSVNASAVASDSTPLSDADDAAPPVDEDPAIAHRRRQFQPVDAPPPRSLRTNHPKGNLSVAERMERDRILARNVKAPVDPNLPDEIQAAERGEPP